MSVIIKAVECEAGDKIYRTKAGLLKQKQLTF